jgi:hypothetical protein
MIYSGAVVIQISRLRRHDLELQLSWDHQSQPTTTTAVPLQHESAYPRQCYVSWCCCLLFIVGDCPISYQLPTWPAGPWQLSPIMTMEIVNTIVRVGVSSSDRMMTWRWRVNYGLEHQRQRLFSLFLGGAPSFLVSKTGRGGWWFSVGHMVSYLRTVEVWRKCLLEIWCNITK